MSETYNGHANYETWLADMWLDGNYTGEHTYREALRIAEEHSAAGGAIDVADALQEFLTDELPDLDGIAADLQRAAASEIDWREIGQSRYDATVKQWEADAKERGADAARDAASWTCDGNGDPAQYARTLQMLDDGDPETYDNRLPRYPDLSGEWADDPTPDSLAREITGSDDVSPELTDLLANAFESGVSDTFEDACVTELRKHAATGDRSC
jgi:hypothetical protein